MKKLLTVIIFFCIGSLYAQDKDIEAEIRRLEQVEAQAVVSKDTATLLKLWDKDYVVNSPQNKIVFAGKNAADRPVMQRMKASYTKEVEQIIIRGNFVFSMGGETIVPAGDDPQAGQIVKRRYTNIWEKQEGGWKLVARHANIICQ